MKVSVVNVSYGIASRYHNLIEINVNIPQKLRKKILKHEFSHTEGSYKWHDFKVDFQSKNPFFLESLKFAWKNKHTFINFFPFMYSYYQKRWTFNLTSIYPIFLWGLIWTISVYLLFGLILAPLLLWLYLTFLGNLWFLLLTHIHVRKVQI